MTKWEFYQTAESWGSKALLSRMAETPQELWRFYDGRVPTMILFYKRVWAWKWPFVSREYYVVWWASGEAEVYGPFHNEESARAMVNFLQC